MHFSTVLLALSAVAVGFAAPARRSAAAGGTSGSGDATFYNPAGGFTSCGQTHQDTDMIVAVDHATITSFPGATANPNANPMCGRSMTVTGPDGKSVTVTVADTCEGCAPGDVDLTPVAFQQLASLDVGRLHGVTWVLN